MSSVVKILPHYTYDDWIHWEGQWELIEGIPYAMSPLPVPQHQRIASNLVGEFVTALKKCSHCHVYQPIDYRVSDDVIVQPDMLIVCGEIKKKFLDFPPALVVEILSPSTALKDRHSKFSIYQQQQIQYYLIVSPGEQVEIYKIENGLYQLTKEGTDFIYDFHFSPDCVATIDFKEIW